MKTIAHCVCGSSPPDSLSPGCSPIDVVIQAEQQTHTHTPFQACVVENHHYISTISSRLVSFCFSSDDNQPLRQSLLLTNDDHFRRGHPVLFLHSRVHATNPTLDADDALPACKATCHAAPRSIALRVPRLPIAYQSFRANSDQQCVVGTN
jgi:hypothetical protein